MDLSKIVAISGKPGLYKMLSQTKNGLVVEAFTDGKKFTAFSHERISTLEEISIYTDEEDKPLKDILKAIFEVQEGKEAISHKSGNDEIKSFFEKVVPDYDRDNVYVSDMKKVINWYNILHAHNMLEFDEEETDQQAEVAEKKASGATEKENPDSGSDKDTEKNK
jgi:hypothetical protein